MEDPLVPSPDVECPRCAEIIKARAKMCRFCNLDLTAPAAAAAPPGPLAPGPAAARVRARSSGRIKRTNGSKPVSPRLRREPSALPAIVGGGLLAMASIAGLLYAVGDPAKLGFGTGAKSVAPTPPLAKKPTEEKLPERRAEERRRLEEERAREVAERDRRRAAELAQEAKARARERERADLKRRWEAAVDQAIRDLSSTPVAERFLKAENVLRNTVLHPDAPPAARVQAEAALGRAAVLRQHLADKLSAHAFERGRAGDYDRALAALEEVRSLGASVSAQLAELERRWRAALKQAEAEVASPPPGEPQAKAKVDPDRSERRAELELVARRAREWIALQSELRQDCPACMPKYATAKVSEGTIECSTCRGTGVSACPRCARHKFTDVCSRCQDTKQVICTARDCRDGVVDCDRCIDGYRTEPAQQLLTFLPRALRRKIRSSADAIELHTSPPNWFARYLLEGHTGWRIDELTVEAEGDRVVAEAKLHTGLVKAILVTRWTVEGGDAYLSELD